MVLKRKFTVCYIDCGEKLSFGSDMLFTSCSKKRKKSETYAMGK